MEMEIRIERKVVVLDRERIAAQFALFKILNEQRKQNRIRIGIRIRICICKIRSRALFNDDHRNFSIQKQKSQSARCFQVWNPHFSSVGFSHRVRASDSDHRGRQ